jgi:hypothetical protein
MRGASIYLMSIAGGVLIALAVAAYANEPPEVTNVTAEQREGTTLVDVYYDLYDPEGDSMTVWLLSSDDGGSHFEVPIMSGLEGSDIGRGITSGQGKHIVWDAAIEYPDQASCEHEVLVYACDGPGCNKSEAYGILGVVRRGALAYFWQNYTFTGGTLVLFGAQDEVDDAICFTYSLSGLSATGFTCTATVDNSFGDWGPNGAVIVYTHWGADPSAGDPGVGAFSESGW